MTILAFLVSLATSLSAGSTLVAGQFRCDAPTANEWLLPSAKRIEGGEIEPSSVYPVEGNLDRAIALLDEESAIPLTQAQLSGFSTKGAGASLKPTHSAYLVRAVYPTTRPQLKVAWMGSDLHVFADGLGCAPFVKHPVIVILDRKPMRVFVNASAAL